MARTSLRPSTALLAALTAVALELGAVAGATVQAAAAGTIAKTGAGEPLQAAAARGAVQAAGTTTPLGRFLGGLHSLRARFTQVVTAAHGRIVAQTTGELIVLRPGKFRWEIHPVGGHGAGQLLVADGRNLWFYDADLQQVTVRPESTALTATPAMLLSGGATALDAFEVSGAGETDGLEWVSVVPKAADADFKAARLGFSGNELARMILEDKLGQTATLTFAGAERNVPVAPSEVSFAPPAGADVIGTPQK